MRPVPRVTDRAYVKSYKYHFSMQPRAKTSREEADDVDFYWPVGSIPLHIHGNYGGPGSRIGEGDLRPPTDEEDYQYYKHDTAVEYDSSLNGGQNPYLYYNDADERLLEGLKPHNSWSAKAAKGWFRFKKKIFPNMDSRDVYSPPEMKSYDVGGAMERKYQDSRRLYPNDEMKSIQRDSLDRLNKRSHSDIDVGGEKRVRDNSGKSVEVNPRRFQEYVPVSRKRRFGRRQPSFRPRRKFVHVRRNKRRTRTFLSKSGDQGSRRKISRLYHGVDTAMSVYRPVSRASSYIDEYHPRLKPYYRQYRMKSTRVTPYRRPPYVLRRYRRKA